MQYIHKANSLISSTSASTATAIVSASASASASVNANSAAAPSRAALAMAQARAAAARVAATAAAAAARVTGTRAGAGNAAAADAEAVTTPAVAAAAPSVGREVTTARIAANAHVGIVGLALSWVRNLVPLPSILDLKQQQPMPKLDSTATAAAATATVTVIDCERAGWGGADELESIISSLNSSLNGICNTDGNIYSSRANYIVSNKGDSGSDSSISGDKSNDIPNHAKATADHSGERAVAVDIAADTAGACACNNSHVGANKGTHRGAVNVVCSGSDANNNDNHDQDSCGDFGSTSSDDNNSRRLLSSICDDDRSTSSENATNKCRIAVDRVRVPIFCPRELVVSEHSNNNAHTAA